MAWSLSKLFRRRFLKSAPRKTIRSRRRPALERLEDRLAPANINITSFHYDPAIQGQDTQETDLTPLNVNSSLFGKLASAPVDGYTYAQPLYVHGLIIGGSPHDVAFVATEHDSVYAFDVVKNATTGAVTVSQLWQRSFITGGPGGPTTPGITSVPQPDIISGDIVPEIGITGAGAIDTTTNTLYVVAKTKEVRADGSHWVQTIHALSLTDGTDRTTPYVIGDTHTSATFANETTAIVVPGVGAETSGGANPMVPFSALKENQRPSLQILNGRVYVGWASHGDNGPYHGWVVGFNETTLQPEKIYCTNPNGGLAGIWQSEGAISTDGRYLYFSTGNGGGAGGFASWDPAHGNYAESVIKIDTQAAGTIMPVADYFTPFNWQSLDSADADLGSGGVMLLPDSVGSGTHLHLMVETGKDGHIYLLDRDNMGQLSPNNSAIVQDVVAGPGGVWGNPAYYQESATSGLIFYHGSGSDSRVFRVSNGQITQVTAGNYIAYRSNQTFGFPGANPVISANGVNNPSSAVIWEVQLDNYGSQGPAVLHAYALPVSGGAVQPSGTLTELYNSNQAGIRDRLSASTKFTSAIVTDGLVFVAQGGGPAAGNPASGTFNVFGEFAPPTQAPAAPTNLTATGVATNTIRLNWTNPSPQTGAQATAIQIFRSVGDDQHFGPTPYATVAAGVTTYTDTVSDPNQVYFYQVRATNQVGNSGFSNEASATPFVQPVLSLGNVASNAVVLSWTRPPVANNRFDVERSSTPDFASFTTVASGLSTNTTTYTDTDPALVSSPGIYYYRVRGYSTAATTPFALSNVVGVKVGPNAGVINYGPPNGFPTPPAPSPFDLQANGDAQFAETTARLTNAAGQTGSVFSAAQENILNWTTTFNVRLHEGTQPYYANGFAFVIQAIGPNTVGQGLTGLGYQGIPNSVALTFDTFTNGFGQTGSTGAGAVGLFVNGDNPGGTPGTGETRILLNPATDNVNLDSQSTKTITLSYAYNAANPAASVLHEVIVDTGPGGGTFTHDYTVNIPALLGTPASGNSTAYVGFTGSTGSIVGPDGSRAPGWELQDILNWVYTPNGPAAPNHLTVVSGTSTNTLNWRTTSADDEGGYYVERSTSQSSGFTRVATVGAGVTTYTDTGLTNPQQYYYRVQQFNNNGGGGTELDSGYSNVATGAVVNVAFATGFPSTAGLTLNGGAALSGTALRLTDGGGSEARSVFYNTPIGTGAFTTTFTFKDQPVGGSADSLNFVIQAVGLTALGAGGGGGGYAGITNSIDIKFDLYSGGTHTSTTGLYTNGATPGQAPGGQSIAITGITLGSGDPIQVTLTYDGTNLLEMVTDTVTHAMFTQSYALNLSQTIGATTAYVGFTGGTGSETAIQDVLNWTGAFAQAPPQVTRFMVSASPTSGTAGQTFQVTVSALDQNGNVLPNYAGTVHFASSDGQATLPANYTFTTADMGVHQFNVTLRTAGNDTITVNDTTRGTVVGTTTVAVSPAALSGFSVSGFPAFVVPGTPGTFTVRAVDAFGNTVPTYAGTAHFTSSDPMALLPGDYTFTTADMGVHMFMATLRSVGPQSITATDTTTMTITGSQTGITVQQSGVTTVNFPDFTNHGNLTVNGNASFPAGTPAVARLADANNNESSSLFYNTLVGAGPFSTTFTFQMRAGTNPIADGLTFVLQADPRGVNALGGGGGAMGFGTDANDGALPAIQHSVAVKFDAYKGFNTGDGNHSSTGLYVNGFRPNNPGSGTVPPGAQPVDLAGTGIDFNAAAQATPAHTFRAMLTYDGATLTETITDTNTMTTFTHSYTVNIAQVIGSNSVHVGFTAGTGGANAFIDLLSWTGSFQQAGIVNINYPNGFVDTSNLTANTVTQTPPLNVFPPAPVQLVANGGFETGSFAPWVQSGDTGATGVGTAPLPGGGTAHGGTHAAYFGPSGGLGYITQTLTTTPGTNYVLDFWLAHPFTDTGTEWLVRVGGNTLNDVHDAGNFGYTEYRYNFTATGTSTDLQFGFLEPPQYFYLDDVTVTSVPASAPLTLTDGRAGEGTTVFSNTPIGTGAFSTTFTLRDTPVTGAADGVSFIIQGDPRGVAALGATGGGEGYAGITNSIAVKFDLYSHGTHNPTTGLFTGGTDPSSNPALDVPLTGINLGSGDPLQVTLVYDGATLTEMVTDTVTHATFSHSYTLNLAQVIGGNSAYVGFGGGTDGETATQQILNWQGQFSPTNATRLAISAPSSVVAGTPFQITVSARDQNGLPFTGYLGTVHFSSSDQAAGLPANYSFTAADNGSHTFTVTLNTVGSQSITATDTATGSIVGTVSGINVALDFSNGFANHGNLTANGTATFVGPVTPANPIGIFAGHQSVGNATGNTTFSNLNGGTYTLTDNGGDIWNQSDNMQYVYETLTGNGEIVARLVSATAPDFWNKMGVMFRNDLSAGSANVIMLDTPNAGHQEPVMQWRDTAGATSADTGNHGTSTTPNVPTPMWLRLVRDGNTFMGYWALDNAGTPGTWQLLGTHTTVLNSTVLVGLAIGNTTGGVITGNFDHVTVTGNTSAPLPTSFARLTDGGASEAGSVFTNTRVADTTFTTTFVLRDQPVNGSADSLSFVLQADPRGATALGAGGGAGGYGPGDTTVIGPPAIVNSIAVKFDLYSHGTHNPTTGLFIGGQAPAQYPAQDVPLTGINLGSGDPIQVTLTYNGVTLTETVVDTVTHATFTHDYVVNIPQLIGSNTAYAGFTAGTGGETAVQDILSWSGTFPTATTPVEDLTVTPQLSTVSAGVPAQITVTTMDAGGHRVGYTGTVHFTSTDPQAVLPADYTFTAADAGQHVFTVTFKTAGNQAVFITDTASSQLAALAGFTVNPAAASTLMVSEFPSPDTAGNLGSVKVTVKDAFGNTVTNYTGTVHLTSSDPQAQLEANHTFTASDMGVYSFGVILKTAGTQAITATDTATATITGSQTGIAVNPSALAALRLSGLPTGPTKSGVPINVTVTAADAYGNPITGYRGTVAFASTDPHAVLPPNYTFVAADNGTHTFPVTFETSGVRTLTVTDAADSLTANSGNITVIPFGFQVSGIPSPVIAGAAQRFTVRAVDANGNTDTGYTGTVHLTSSDPQAHLSANYTFTAADMGVHTSFGAVLKTAGTQSVTATDTANAMVTGSETGIVVTPRNQVGSFAVTGFPGGPAGTAGTFTVRVLDPYGNVDTGYRGTLHFTSSDPQAVLPADYTFTAADMGVHTFSATLKTAGMQSITATDSAAQKSGTETGIQVTPGAAVALRLSSTSHDVNLGDFVFFTVTGVDAYGNAGAAYTGTVHFTSSDPQASLPDDYTFQPSDGGTQTFVVVFGTPGTQSVTATDTMTGTLTGTLTFAVV